MSACTAWATTVFIGSDTEVRVWEEPVRGSFGDPYALSLPGMERMRLSTRGQGPKPPIHHLTGLIPVEAGFGSSTFRMPVTPWLQTTVPGLMVGGVIAFLADGPLGTAIVTMLPPLQYMTTSDLSLSFLQPATLDSGALVARAPVAGIACAGALWRRDRHAGGRGPLVRGDDDQPCRQLVRTARPQGQLPAPGSARWRPDDRHRDPRASGAFDGGGDRGAHQRGWEAHRAGQLERDAAAWAALERPRGSDRAGGP